MRKKILVLSVFVFIFSVFSVSASLAWDTRPHEGGEGFDRHGMEEPLNTEPEKPKKSTWIHPERWTEDDTGVQIIIRPEDISMKSYTVYFKGARSGDTVTITNQGNCLVGDAHVIEFDSDRKCLVTILPRNYESAVYFFSGLFHTRGENIPFSIAWKPWATEVRYITGVDIFKE